MLKPLKIVAASALAFSLTSVAHAQDADTVVATVNGTDITLGHMIALRERLPENYQNLPDETLFEGILEQLIQQTALGQQADSLSRRGELVLENERRALKASEVIRSAARDAVTDEAIGDAYDRTYANAESETEYNASHILVASEEEALALVEDIEGGADFAELAKANSTGPSGPNGRELGWFSDGMMVKPFEQAVQGLEVGQISEPVQTQFGWHVIKLNDRREKETPSLEEVRQELAATVQQEAVEAIVADVTDTAKIERAENSVDPALLRDTSLLDQ